MSQVNPELERAQGEIASTCDLAIFSSLPNVTYISGFEIPQPIGAFAAATHAPPFAVVNLKDNASWLVVSVFSLGAAKQSPRVDEVLGYDAFGVLQEANSRETYLAALRTILRRAGIGENARIGIEDGAFPYSAAETLRELFPRVTLVDITNEMTRARMIKTPREIELLRHSNEITAIGHRTLAELVKTPGLNECDMFGTICSNIFQAAGHEIPVLGELVSGARTNANNYPGGPRNRVTEKGDAVLMDISQRVDGYWSDCTNTHIVGGVRPTAGQQRYVDATQKAFEAGLEKLRAGNKTSDVWQAARRVYEQHGLEMNVYMGHSIGASVNELPRLVPYDHTVIQENMVFAMEPDAHEGPDGTFGCRFEKNILITASGPEILTPFDWGL